MPVKLGQLVLMPLVAVLLFQSHLLMALSAVPLLYAFYSHGRGVGLFISMLSIAFFGLMHSGTSILFFVFFGPLFAVIFYEASLKMISLEKSFLMTTGLMFFSALAVVLFLSNGQPYSFLQQNIAQFIASLPSKLEVFNLATPQAAELKAQLAEFSNNAVLLSQSILKKHFLGYFFSILISMQWLCLITLRRFGFKIFNVNLTKWKTPEPLVWVFIVAFFFTLISSPVLTPISHNVSHVLMSLYFLQGLSIATFFIRKKKTSSLMKVLSYSLLTFFPFVTISLGFSDLWINFRNRKNKKKESPYESHFKRRN